MAYIGKRPAQIKRDLGEKDSFTGDGSTTTFDLTSDALDSNTIQVFVDNVRQEPGTGKSYNLGLDGSSNLRRITFTVAPDASAAIYVINPRTTDTTLNTVSCGAIDAGKLATGAVTSAKILDGTIANADVSPSAAIADSKLATITTASKVNVSALSAPGSASVFLKGDRTYGAICTAQIDTNAFNISLLGFKMAVNEGLTVFNLVDGIVDEFHDESGTDEAEGSNDTYCASDDFYQNLAPSGSPVAISAGFSMTAITEPQTSTAGTNPKHGSGTFGSFTVPAGLTSTAIKVWGAGGASCGSPGGNASMSGGGGFASGTLATTPGQVLHINAGEGGGSTHTAYPTPFPAVEVSGSSVTVTKASGVNAMWGGGYNAGQGTHCAGGGGGGAAGVFTTNLGPLNANVSANYPNSYPRACQAAHPQVSSPQFYMIAGAGGASTYWPSGASKQGGGAGGGLIGHAGGLDIPQNPSGQNSASGGNGGGGDQEQGGEGSTQSTVGYDGGLLFGGASREGSAVGAGGSGYYGGGGGGGTYPSGGGGGSSYYGHPQITSGATEAGGEPNPQGGVAAGGGTGDPQYQAGTNEGKAAGGGDGEDGYVFLTGSFCAVGSTSSTTIVSTAFTSTAVPTTSRIVVFQENVDTPTLNTDIIASISRDGGSNFTTATLSDSGYVTGSSGQRILTGQATISGQPSGQSMRWKLALANNTVKIHGVSLQWA